MVEQAPHFTLVLGGARSGKSRYAEGLITGSPPPWIYVATAHAGDAEMAQRIALDMLRDDHHAFQVSVRNSRD